MKRSTRFTLSLLAGLTLAAHRSLTAPVSFGFSGLIDSTYHPNAPLPPGLAEGQPFQVIVTYDPDLLPASPESPSDPAKSDYYTTNPAAFRYWSRFGPVEAILADPAPSKTTQSINMRNGQDGLDSIDFSVSGPDVSLNHTPAPAGQTVSLLTRLWDASTTIFATDSLPLTLPPVTGFQRAHYAIFEVDQTNVGAGQSPVVYSVRGQITEITTTPRPPLTLTHEPGNKLRVSWPKVVPGFVLETAAEVDSSPWTAVAGAVADTPTDHVVVLKLGPTRAFFRLHKD